MSSSKLEVKPVLIGLAVAGVAVGLLAKYRTRSAPSSPAEVSAIADAAKVPATVVVPLPSLQHPQQPFDRLTVAIPDKYEDLAPAELERDYSGQECHQIESILMEPYEYLLQTKGKGVRNILIDAFQLWLRIPENRLSKIKKIIEKLHNSSLLIDDIEDGSKLRRGKPVAHSIFGEASVINCANLCYFRAMAECQQLGNAKAVDCFIEEMCNLHRGQGLDIYWRDHGTCPTLGEYKSMVIDKTGGVFRLAVKLMQAFSDNDTNYLELANNLGLFFQIRDDYANLQLDEYTKNKSFCEDITEGKFSFPIIHCILTRPTDRRLLHILKQRAEDLALKKHAIEFMAECGSFEFTRHALEQLRLEIVEQISALGGNKILSVVLEKLCKDVL